MVHRRIRGRSGLAAPILVGLGLGLAAGFLLGELYSGTGLRGVRRALVRWRSRSTERPSAQVLTAQIQDLLAPALGTDSQSLELVAVGRRGLELHGWVTSRQARARALTAGRHIVGPDRYLVDRLLVWGEDDVVSAAPPPMAEELETG